MEPSQAVAILLELPQRCPPEHTPLREWLTSALAPLQERVRHTSPDWDGIAAAALPIAQCLEEELAAREDRYSVDARFDDSGVRSVRGVAARREADLARRQVLERVSQLREEWQEHLERQESQLANRLKNVVASPRIEERVKPGVIELTVAAAWRAEVTQGALQVLQDWLEDATHRMDEQFQDALQPTSRLTVARGCVSLPPDRAPPRPAPVLLPMPERSEALPPLHVHMSSHAMQERRWMLHLPLFSVGGGGMVAALSGWIAGAGLDFLTGTAVTTPAVVLVLLRRMLARAREARAQRRQELLARFEVEVRGLYFDALLATVPGIRAQLLVWLDARRQDWDAAVALWFNQSVLPALAAADEKARQENESLRSRTRRQRQTMPILRTLRQEVQRCIKGLTSATPP